MRTTRPWVVAACLGFLLALVGPAAHAADADCPENGLFLNVTDGPNGPNAMTVANGWNCPNVNLRILSDLNITVKKLNIDAASVEIKSAIPGTSPNIQVVNNAVDSEINIRTGNTVFGSGNIIINGGDVKAHKRLSFTCSASQCVFDGDFSNLIAATSFLDPDTGGGLFFNIKGPIDIRTSLIHGGDTVEVKSVDSSITLICGGAPGDCKDPLAAPIPPIIVDACGNPPAFPCDVRFPNAPSLTAVCIPVEQVACNGGRKEKRFTAGTFLDFKGSFITSDEHVTFTCGTAIPAEGDLRASGATFIMDSLFIKCPGRVDLSNSTISLVNHLNASTAGDRCPVAVLPAGETCINVSGAKIASQPLILTANNAKSIIDACGAEFTLHGSGFPKLNNKTTPGTYPQTTVKFTDAQCGGAGTGAKFLNN